MKLKLNPMLGCLVASAALVSAQVAHAQESCVAQEDFTDAVIYAVPVISESFEKKCATELSPDGFIATQGEAFVAPYRELSDESWPGAARVLNVFANSESKGENGIPALAGIFSSGSEETVRPFIDLLLGTMVASEIKLKDCRKVERGIELMAPLPPENMGGMITFLVDMAGVKDPELCPLED